MINFDFGTFAALLILGLLAIFGYYRGFLALITRQTWLSETRLVRGRTALALGLVQIAGAIAASAVAILFFFSQLK